MKAVIFAAGKGTRMLPLTLDKPKPLLTVLGKPLIQYTFEAVPDSIEEVVMVVGYKGEQLRAYFGSEFLGKHITYVYQERVGGTAEALLLARPLLSEGRFLALYADDIYAKVDAEKLLTYDLGLVVAEVPDPKPFGVVELGPDDRIISFEEKPSFPKSNLVSAGILLLDQRIFNYTADPHPVTGERYITDMVQGLLRDVPFYGVRATRWISIGHPDDLKRAEEMLKKS